MSISLTISRGMLTTWEWYTYCSLLVDFDLLSSVFARRFHGMGSPFLLVVFVPVHFNS